MKICSLLFLTSVLLFTSCTTLDQIVVDRASYDFPCPKDNIKISEITLGSYEASGCEKKAVYNCQGGGSGGVLSCSREKK